MKSVNLLTECKQRQKTENTSMKYYCFLCSKNVDELERVTFYKHGEKEAMGYCNDCIQKRGAA